MMQLSDALAWVILGALILYALSGGADFGGGVWDLLARGPRAGAQRKLIEQAMAPVWEANHVWLILALVLLFSGFPIAFARIGILLHVPLTLLLAGIVLRGAAFIFRQYGGYTDGAHAWGHLFAWTSALAPIFLGVCLGAVTSGALSIGTAPSDVRSYFTNCFQPFPLAVGVLTLTLFAWLAAIYLLQETKDAQLRADFRRRALVASAILCGLELAIALLLPATATHFRQRFFSHPVSWTLQGLHALCAFVVVLALVQTRALMARRFAVAQVVLLLLGWGFAQYPYLLAPDLSLADAAAPASTLRWLLIALAAGSCLLFPSLYLLFRIFKRPTI